MRMPNLVTRRLAPDPAPPEAANGIEFESMDDLADRIDTQKAAIAKTVAKLQQENENLDDLIRQMTTIIEARQVLNRTNQPYVFEED